MTETTPLLPNHNDGTDDHEAAKRPAARWIPSVVFRILLCGFVTSLSIAFTQVPMLYAFRLMACEEYYKTHASPSVPEGGDRCSINAIEADTAKQIAILSASTTIVGVMNLLLTGWEIKRFGVRFAMVQQTFWPAVRLCWQAVGVAAGAKPGIVLIQTSQLTCFFGGPAGYMLVLNSFVSELVAPTDRTVVFGKLQGCVMFGTACGYFLGGLIGDIFGILSPWELAFCSMVFTTLYSALVLPYVPPPPPPPQSSDRSDRERSADRSLFRFLGPAKVLAPQTWRWPDGSGGGERKYHGVLLLATGIFAGVLATGYIPTLIQLYSTSAFGFGTKENGAIMSFYCLMRGFFLMFAFPRIISHGRKRFAPDGVGATAAEPRASPGASDAQTEAEDVEAAVALGIDDDDGPAAALPEQRDSEFDLFFLKWSLVLDGFLTGIATFSRKSWHIVAVASLLPIASGSAPAAKSVMIDMCSADQRADALNAISLIEMIAKLSTVSLFGFVFSALAEVGKPNLVFTCNAAVAVFAVAVLLFCRFPPTGSVRVGGAGDGGSGAGSRKVGDGEESGAGTAG